MKTVPSVFTFLFNTIYPSHSTKVAEGTVIRKHKVSTQFIKAPSIGTILNYRIVG